MAPTVINLPPNDTMFKTPVFLSRQKSEEKKEAPVVEKKEEKKITPEKKEEKPSSPVGLVHPLFKRIKNVN